MPWLTLYARNADLNRIGERNAAVCGIVFDRYRSAPEPLPPLAPTPSPGEVGPSTLGRFYRVLRWVVLVGIVALVVLVLAVARESGKT